MKSNDGAQARAVGRKGRQSEANLWDQAERVH